MDTYFYGEEMTAFTGKADFDIMWRNKNECYVALTSDEVEMLVLCIEDDEEYWGNMKDKAKCREKTCPEYEVYQMYKKLKKALKFFGDMGKK